MRLSPESWERVKILFVSALEYPPEARGVFLRAKCSDTALLAEVERLLDLDAQRGEFLETGIRPVKKTETCFSGDVLAGRFRVIQFIAKGGMGEVYEAEDLELQEHVAIKMVRQEILLHQGDAAKRFKREIRLAKQVTHPNVCRIFDLFRHHPQEAEAGANNVGEVVFVSMELLRGETLAQRLRSTGKMTTEETLPIVLQMSSGLQAAHDIGILHRDFKPGNVFLVPTREKRHLRVVITDFGLALGLDPGVNAGLTPISVNQFFGTPAYMCPEQLEDGELTPASDVYSLGLVIYQMVTGMIPFDSETPLSTGLRRLREPLASPRVHSPEVNRLWESVILKCVERDPAKRFQCAAEVANALTAKSDVIACSRRTKGFESLAILPFENVSGAPDAEYLSDGITESIINTLSCIPDLRVIARSTVFRYKTHDADPRAIGRLLNVGSVLTGRVTHGSDRLNITTELVDVNSGWRLWGEHYSRMHGDVFTVQADIAHEISIKLRLKLSVEEKKRLAKRPTHNAEAYQLFLKGRYHWNKKTELDVRKSIECFNQAIHCDPMFARAYAGLADAYATLGFFLTLSSPPNEVMPKAHAAARRALEIDDSLAEAHASLGMVSMRFNWDFAEAQSLFRRALQLNPTYGPAHQWQGECSAAMGNLKGAIGSLKRALESDPLSLTINAVLGGMFCFAREYDLAIEQCKKTLEMDEHFWPALKFFGLSCLGKGAFDAALAAFEKGVASSGKNSLMLATLGHAYAVAGMRDRAEELLQDLRKLEPRAYVPSICSAFIQTALGATDAAFAELEKAFEERSGWLVFLRVDPRFDPLRTDPRFDALLQKMGFISPRFAA
jgi:serine/threonine-protein kinase